MNHANLEANPARDTLEAIRCCGLCHAVDPTTREAACSVCHQRWSVDPPETTTLPLAEVARVLASIEEAAAEGDYEVAHGREDALYVRVLRAIAEGRTDDARALAGAALAAQDIGFDRVRA